MKKIKNKKTINNDIIPIQKAIANSITLKQKLLTQTRPLKQLAQLAHAIVQTFHAGGRLLIAGNGGSAADAQHIAAELVGRFMRERRALPAIALSTDTSILTALGNDYNFKIVFARQIQALGQRGDIFLGISTSGNSANVIEALKTARAMGLSTAGLAGGKGGQMAPLCDYLICLPSKDTPRLQESMVMLEHILCELVEDAIFYADTPKK